MIQIDTKLRKWGNSLGIVVPLSKLKDQGIKEGENVTVLVSKKENVLKETFGTSKFSKSTGELLKEIDKELDYE